MGSFPAALASPPVSTPASITRIRPSAAITVLDAVELWESRELLYFLVWRDIKVRYKQTALGALWAVLQPLMTMIVFSTFFGRLARIPSDGIPYPLFAYAGLVPWTFFSTALTQSSNSLVEHARLLTKVYFPRMLVPAASVVAGLVDLAIALAMAVPMLVYYGVAPSAALLTVPALMLLTAIAVLANGLWLSALNVRYRDVRYVLPFVVQLWLFATPVAYPSSLVPERWRALYALNPMTGIVNAYRWALLGTPQLPGELLLSIAATLIVFVAGMWFFRSVEGSFADTL